MRESPKMFDGDIIHTTCLSTTMEARKLDARADRADEDTAPCLPLFVFLHLTALQKRRPLWRLGGHDLVESRILHDVESRFSGRMNRRVEVESTQGGFCPVSQIEKATEWALALAGGGCSSQAASHVGDLQSECLYMFVQIDQVVGILFHSKRRCVWSPIKCGDNTHPVFAGGT